MNTTLNDFSTKESNLLNKMPEGGTFQVRDEFLKKHNLYNEWHDIFLEYVDLGLLGETEALKRALFFIWYSCSEPYELSGLKHIDKSDAIKVLSRLNTMAKEKALDPELCAMLPYYFTITEWYLADYEGLENLLDERCQKNDLCTAQMNKNSFKNRGVLGEYWTSIL